MTHRSNRRTFLALAGSAGIAGLAGCGTSAGGDGPSEPDPTTTASTTDSAIAAAPDDPTETGGTPGSEAGAGEGPAVVDMITDNRGSYFDPRGLLVEPETTVRFVNASGVHATAAYHPDNDEMPLRIPTAAESWDSGLCTEEKETFEVTLTTRGVYDYYCAPHESLGMVGRIVVGEPLGGPGTTDPEGLPPGARTALPPIEEIVERGIVEGP